MLVGTKAPERKTRGKRMAVEMPWTVCAVLATTPSSANIQLMHHEQKTTRTPPVTAPAAAGPAESKEIAHDERESSWRSRSGRCRRAAVL